MRSLWLKGFKVIVLCCLTTINASANDAVFYTSGSMLVPAQETVIGVSREVLTITIGNGERAQVDVSYEFSNPGQAKTLLVAFEAEAPYNADAKLSSNGHPFIHDFTVTMNGKPLAVHTGIVEASEDIHPDAKPQLKLLDPKEWQGYGDAPEDKLPYPDNLIYNSRENRTAPFAYAYHFDAPFKEGLNTIHHTYSYEMSQRVGVDYEIYYWLLPAVRWANRQIDDFTLRIVNERDEAFCMTDSIFSAASFKAVEGVCWQLSQIPGYDGKPSNVPTLLASEHSIIEWHTTNFVPAANMMITCADALMPSAGNRFFLGTSCMVVLNKDEQPVGQYLGTCADQYLIDAQDYGLVPKAGHKVKKMKAENGEGYLVIRPEYKAVNVRQRPSAKSPIVTTFMREDGELPDVYDCLGIVHDEDAKLIKQWYHIRSGQTTGYINANLLDWSGVNRY